MVARLHEHWRMLAGSVFAAMALCACSSGALRAFFGPPDEEDEDIVAVSPRAARGPEAPLSARLALPPPASKPPVTERVVRVSPRRSAALAARKPRPVVPAPVVSVAGLSEAEVLSVMGEPHQRSARGGRRIWTYTGAGCRVEVTFFRDVTAGAYAALSQKVVGADGAAREACDRSVRRASR